MRIMLCVSDVCLGEINNMFCFFPVVHLNVSCLTVITLLVVRCCWEGHGDGEEKLVM